MAVSISIGSDGRWSEGGRSASRAEPKKSSTTKKGDGKKANASEPSFARAAKTQSRSSAGGRGGPRRAPSREPAARRARLVSRRARDREGGARRAGTPRVARARRSRAVSTCVVDIRRRYASTECRNVKRADGRLRALTRDASAATSGRAGGRARRIRGARRGTYRVGLGGVQGDSLLDGLGLDATRDDALGAGATGTADGRGGAHVGGSHGEVGGHGGHLREGVVKRSWWCS